MSQFAIAVLWCVVQVTLVSLLALSVCAVARRFAPAAGTSVPLAGLVLIIGLSILALSPWPSWFDFAPTSARAPVPEVAQAKIPASYDAAGLKHSENPEVRDPVSPAPSEQDSQFWPLLYRELSRPASVTAVPAPRSRWPVGLTILLAAGALFGALHLAAGLCAVRSYRRRSRLIADPELVELADVLRAEFSLTRRVEVCQCDQLVTAATVGWLRPLVLLPPEWHAWKDHERRAVLAHELAHIARNDFLRAVVAQVSLSLHFYHPLVHWLAARLRLEQELAADAAAATLAGGPSVYLRTLADLALRQPERRMSWPARTFLPTRGTLLRRIEMLRDTRRLPAKTSLACRLSLVALLVLAGLAATGLRGPSGLSPLLVAEEPAATAAQDDPQAAEPAPSDKAGIELAYVAEDAVAVAAVRPAGLLRRSDMKDVRERLEELLAPQLGMSPAEIEQVTLVVHRESVPGRPGPKILPACGIILRAVKPNDFRKSVEQILPDGVEKKLGGAPGQSYFRSPDPNNGVCYYRPDNRTLVIDLEEPIVRSIVGKPKPAPLVAGDAWKKAAMGQLAIAVDGVWLRSQIAPAEGGPAAAFGGPLEAFSPLWLEAETLTLSAHVGDKLTLRAAGICGSADGAKKVQDTAEAARTLTRNLAKPLRKQLAEAPPAERPILDSLLELGEKMLDDLKFEREGKVVEAVTETDVDPLKLSLVTMMVVRARDAAQRMSSMNNLKQLGLAMHNYLATYDHFPAAAILGPDGKTVHSWRVAILPYIEQDALYRQYKLDEPWDSENNKKILAMMPAVFRHPLAPKDSTSADYYVLTGERTVFSNKPAVKGTPITGITDGTSNTFMIVEAKRDIPWTKPEDIPYAADKPLPKLGGWTEGGFHAAMCDGSVHLIGGGIEERLFRAWVSRDGGEPISFDAGLVPPKAAGRRIGPDKVDGPSVKPRTLKELR